MRGAGRGDAAVVGHRPPAIGRREGGRGPRAGQAGPLVLEVLILLALLADLAINVVAVLAPE